MKAAFYFRSYIGGLCFRVLPQDAQGMPPNFHGVQPLCQQGKVRHEDMGAQEEPPITSQGKNLARLLRFLFPKQSSSDRFSAAVSG